jgi:hypothetical protein
MHEIYDVNPGESRSMLELIADVAVPAYKAHGAQLVGAFRTGRQPQVSDRVPFD